MIFVSFTSFSLSLSLSLIFFFVIYQWNASVDNAYDRSIAVSVPLSLFPLAPLEQMEHRHTIDIRIRRNESVLVPTVENQLIGISLYDST